MACTIAVTRHDDVPVVALAGELDVSTSDDVTDAFAGALAGGPAVLVFDLSALSFCDSSGVRSLEESERLGRDRGTRVVLAGPTPGIRRLLQISGLDDYFTIAPNVEAALTG